MEQDKKTSESMKLENSGNTLDVKAADEKDPLTQLVDENTEGQDGKVDAPTLDAGTGETVKIEETENPAPSDVTPEPTLVDPPKLSQAEIIARCDNNRSRINVLIDSFETFSIQSTRGTGNEYMLLSLDQTVSYLEKATRVRGYVK